MSMPETGRLSAKVASTAASAWLQRTTRPRRDQVLFNSYDGKFSDSPRAIHTELRRRAPSLHHVWVSSSDHESGLPDGERVVDLRALSDQRCVGASRLIVSNVEMPSTYQKRRGSTYLQTWHGTPLKRLGRDRLDWSRGPRSWLQSRELAKWDLLVSQNRFSSEIYRRAFRFDGTILEVGHPRNDLLLSNDRDEVRRRVRADLRLDPDQRVILYAPTYRDDQRGQSAFAGPLDLVSLSAQLGPSTVILMRLHHFLRGAVLALGANPALRDVSDYPEMAELYLAADVLVTDYSSSMFDFAVTGKPMVFYTYDLESYRDTSRGLYIDFEAEAPGPLCETPAELAAALGDVTGDASAYAARYDAFRARFCYLDDGRATERVVDHLLGSVLS
jgi:CDP-glycerol glycerophosphotransferase